jgi:hypothetical protein
MIVASRRSAWCTASTGLSTNTALTSRQSRLKSSRSLRAQRADVEPRDALLAFLQRRFGRTARLPRLLERAAYSSPKRSRRVSVRRLAQAGPTRVAASTTAATRAIMTTEVGFASKVSADVSRLAAAIVLG